MLLHDFLRLAICANRAFFVWLDCFQAFIRTYDNTPTRASKTCSFCKQAS
jgi:hypothetical protein